MALYLTGRKVNPFLDYTNNEWWRAGMQGLSRVMWQRGKTIGECKDFENPHDLSVNFWKKIYFQKKGTSL